MGQILDASSIPSWQLHDVSLQSPLSGIACHGLAPGRGGGLVISTDPRRKALVWHLPRDIAVYGGDELVV